MDLFRLIRTLTYVGLLCAALWLNRRCWRTLLLSGAVGASVFVPVPFTGSVPLWYFQCFVFELLIILIAVVLRVTASPVIVTLGGLLGIAHLTGMYVGPQPGFGPYRAIVPLLEVLMLLVCCLLSETMIYRAGQGVASQFLPRKKNNG